MYLSALPAQLSEMSLAISQKTVAGRTDPEQINIHDFTILSFFMNQIESDDDIIRAALLCLMK